MIYSGIGASGLEAAEPTIIMLYRYVNFLLLI